MRRFISKTFIFLGIFSIVMGAFSSYGIRPSYAENLELRGDTAGLVINPSNNLFNLTNLNPGDTVEAEIDIKNEYTRAFNLSMKAERIGEAPGEEDVDLFEQLIITVYYGADEVYSGPMKDFASTNIDLGRYNPGDEKILRAVVHLPGPETGNEFQGAAVDVKWIFTAQADQPTDPDPGGGNPDPGPDPDPTPDPDPEPEPDPDDEVIEVEDEVDIPEEEEDDTVIEVEDEVDLPTLPKTGSKSNLGLMAIGIILLVLGLGLYRKKEINE